MDWTTMEAAMAASMRGKVRIEPKGDPKPDPTKDGEALRSRKAEEVPEPPKGLWRRTPRRMLGG